MATFSSKRLPGRTVSKTVVGPDGQPAVLIEAFTIRIGQRVTLTFESTGKRWRQGVYLQTNGRLRTAETTSPSLVLWGDAAPKTSVIEVVETNGQFILYNVWDRGQGRQSQGWTSGMYVQNLPDGWTRYSCTDTGTEPNFGQLVFRLHVD
jgi:hypothetical protein